jgi:hypothetical protein
MRSAEGGLIPSLFAALGRPPTLPAPAISFPWTVAHAKFPASAASCLAAAYMTTLRQSDRIVVIH